MNKIVTIILSTVFFMGLFSCETMDDPKIKNTSTWPLNGEYWVTYDGADAPSGYHKVIISNTAADDGKSVLINDGGQDFTIKANADMEVIAFDVTDYQVDDTTTVSISNGQVIEEGTMTPASNVPTDSLYMEMEIVTPSQTDQVTISGYKYTGWTEDNH